VKHVGLEFSSFASKLTKERRQVMHVASSWRSRGSEAENGRFDGVGCGVVEIKSKYPSLTVISFLACRGILVFWLDLYIRLKG
jgi:hypothetical protein